MARIIAVALLVPVAAVVLVLAVALAALSNLDHPWLKARIAAGVEASTGVRLDYQTARVALLSGLRVEGLVVRTPPLFQEAAPELLRAGTLEARWSPGELLGGNVRVEQLTLRDVAFTLVADDAGPTSLTELTGPKAPEPSPVEEPLGNSQQLAAFLASAPPFGKIELSGVSLGYVRVRNGAVIDRWSLRGLAATIEAKQQDGDWKLFAELGQPRSPLPLELSREGQAQAGLELALSVEAGASAARVRVDLDVTRQTFEPRLTLRRLLHGTVLARFDGEKRQTVLQLNDTQLADSADAQVWLELPDAEGVAPVLTRALVDVDLARLLRGVPADWRPFSLQHGDVHLEANDVTLSALPQLGAQGGLLLEVQASTLQLAQDGLQVAFGDGRFFLVASREPQGGLDAKLVFSVQGLDVKGPTSLQVPKAHGELKGQGLRPDLSGGHVSLSGMVEALRLRTPSVRVAAERLGYQLQAPVVGEAPYTLKADVPVGALQVALADGREVHNGPARVKLDVLDAFPVLDDPRLSRARAHLALDVGPVHASLDATKGTDDLAYTLAFETPDLAAARPFIPETVAARFPWKQLGVSLGSKGRLTALFSPAPRVEHRTELRLLRPGWDDVTASHIAVVLSSRGDAWRHKGELDLQVEGLRAGETDLGPQHQTATLDVDRRKPSVRLTLTSHAGLKTSLDAALAFDRKARALRVDVTSGHEPLGPLSSLLARARVPKELDSARLAVSSELHGTLHGVFKDITADGAVILMPDLVRTVSFEGTAVVNAKGFRWRQDAFAINAPALQWKAESHAEGPRRTVQSNLTVEKLNVGLSDRRVVFTNLSTGTTAVFTGHWESDEIQLTHRMKAGTVEHQPALPYPVQDLEASFSVRHKPHGVIHIPDLQVVNAATNTWLKAKGRLDFSDNRRRLAVEGALEQDLSRLAQPGVLESSGKVSVDFKVASPDLVTFQTVSTLLLQGVNVRMPGAGIAVQALDGSVPVTENVEVTESGVRLLSDIEVNPYSMLRFADQHPLLSRSGYLSADSITTPFLSISPLAGNLSVSQTVFSMSQLEMGVRGGRITGRGVLDWRGKSSNVEAHVRATGVQSSRGEPFDGNAAMVISGKDRSINGRAEILRIGNRHLLDLLDLGDPHHTDPATNRVRYALKLGYPKHVRVSFNHGFGRLSIDMGGVARLISIDEIRGIPMGPIIDRTLNSLALPEATP